MTLSELITQNQEFIVSGLLIILSFFVAKLAYMLITEIVRKLTSKTKTDLDDKVINALNKPILTGVFLLGCYLSITRLTSLAEHFENINKGFFIMGAVWIAFVAARVLGIVLSYYVAKKKMDKFQKTSFLNIKNIVNIFIYIIAIFVILRYLGVEITPLVAGLGVGGIAVALALQSTLSNYFAGIYIATEKAIKIGDFVQLENGLTGHVYEIGWRTTKIKTPTDNMIVIPNSNLSNMIVTNYHEPAEEMSVSLACGVSYESDLEKVEKVTTDVAKKVLRKMPGGVKNFEPVVRYKEFGDSNINFSVILRVKSYSDQFLVIHEFIKELMKAYKKNKIEISYPVRKIYETKTKAS